ncbi:uncharacterized protein FOMMEDRAFT_103536 [Fomitiporia mediterranea MF3/22]|uniref:uncharacterized protein n=1 Tax=Fomitiporia mediterranea (strain MF3/22) TaxID=694068 RepID=UPI00044074B0|nr:uncharacterized protein FOMMEDRAFT_103536 [Fomitiporia mediterranea MF3/22]EJD05481.1 hypothetical protein FOMMEDRAFT_103536 [Fomitiporia mediterranea MF3/22]
MAKGQKSSATSATRKKHALKATGGAKQELPLPKEKKKDKGKGKGKNKEPRVKVFIPPSKPAPIRPDPLDSLGIAKRLPPDILIVLRRLGKKDSITKRKALEELQSGWLDKISKGDDDSGTIEATLTTSLPVWLHHLPSLLLNVSRRIRLLAAAIHTSLLRIQSLHEQFVFFLTETGDVSQIEPIIGSWCMAAEDVDRMVSIQAKQAWDLVFQSLPTSSSGINLDDNYLKLLLRFIRRALFDPMAVYSDLNPIQPSVESSLPAHASPRNKGAPKRPPIPPIVEEDASLRKPEEEEESDDDRKGRFRVGALGVLRWLLEKDNISISEQLSELLSYPLLWTSLYHGSAPPFCDTHSSSGFIGDEQPAARKAGWSVLRILLRKHSSYVDETILRILSSAVLRSAWVEPDSGVQSSMWEPLLKFLTSFPQAWNIDTSASTLDNEAGENDEESDDDSSEGNKDTEDNEKTETTSQSHSEAFREFLLFLELGCYGSPAQGYPTIVIILSTIPPPIIGKEPDSWSDFLTSFWAALDGRALTSLAAERALASSAFLSALLECLILLIKRSRVFSDSTSNNDEDNRTAAKTILGQQFGRVWEELIKDRLKVQDRTAGKLFTQTFARLADINDALFAAAWDPISSSVTAALSPEHREPPSASIKRFTAQFSLLRSILNESKGLPDASSWSTKVSVLVCTAARVLLEQTDEQLGNTGKTRLRLADTTLIQRLVETLRLFGELLLRNSDLTPRIDAVMSKNISGILQSDVTVQLLIVFLRHRGDNNACLSLWHDTLKVISSDTVLQEEALPILLVAAERDDLPDFLKPEDDEMDRIASRLVLDLLSSDEQKESLKTTVERLLKRPCFFISSRAASDLLRTIASVFAENSRNLIRDAESSASLVPLRTPLMLLSSVIDTQPTVALSEEVRAFLPDVFVFGYILPRAELLSSEARILCTQARQIWTTAISLEGLSSEERDALQSSVRSLLRDLLSDINSRAPPEAILEIVYEGHAGNAVDLMSELFPSQDQLEALLYDLPSNPVDPILAIVDPLIPPQSMWKDVPNRVRLPYDRSGLCEFARVVNSLLLVASKSRDFARQNIWLLRHFLILSLAASERRLVPSATSAFFSCNVPESILEEITTRVKALTAFLLSDVGDEDWHASLIQTYEKGKNGDQTVFAYRNFPSFVLHMLESAARRDDLQESRAFCTVVQYVLNGAVRKDAEQWMTLAKRLENRSPNTALAIAHAVNKSGLEPPSLDRYRNELAASALGVGASKANTDGVALLHRLNLVAPDPNSDVVFLPQNRAINFMKACQSWIASDEDISEDVESEMTLVFQHLAPILQTVSGAHWDFVFDVVENNLENCSFVDTSSLVALTRTLKLILIIQDLCGSNKSLRAAWQEREMQILSLVRNIVQHASGSSASIPRSICWEMALKIVQNLPLSLIDHETLPKMVHLILDPSPEVAKMAYEPLFRAARKRTEYLVVEAAVETSNEMSSYEIPPELLQVLQDALEPDDGSDPKTFAYLLGWMIIFDLFDEASLRVKIGYATQLRNLDLIGSNFLPFIFDLLEVYRGRGKPFPLEQWSVEEYFVQFYDTETRLSPRLLAAHLFYRALLNVPSLIASWWTGCKDRQLVIAVSNLTTKYYSPVLIAAELQHVKDPAGVAELSGENWNVKVAAGVGEVAASYTVDEQVMEIAICLPRDYPLHGIEVREVQKLGVEENRWRGWLLAVQQIVTSQNGRIVDGLSIFKKNVTHHFENQTECAICYSIISVTELSLPKKRCKTCKNRFHAGCLFKWFNTSHTSSCPLCRSDFI